MNALRQRIIENFPNKEPGVAGLILDSIAYAPQFARTTIMDELSVSYLGAGLRDPFDQRTREEILGGGLDDEAEPEEDEAGYEDD